MQGKQTSLYKIDRKGTMTTSETLFTLYSWQNSKANSSIGDEAKRQFAGEFHGLKESLPPVQNARKVNTWGNYKGVVE